MVEREFCAEGEEEEEEGYEKELSFAETDVHFWQAVEAVLLQRLRIELRGHRIYGISLM